MVRRLAPAGTPIGAVELVKWLASSLSREEALRLFEEQIRRRLGVRHCFLVSSGRAALVIVLRALRRLSGPGRDEVVIPAYTCHSVPAAVVRAGFTVRLCDVDPRTLDYDQEALEKTDFRRVFCLIATSLYGMPNDLAHLARFAGERGVPLLDDAAQCLGAATGGRDVGTFGEAGILSFDKGKNITSIEGGCVVCTNDLLAEALRRERRTLRVPSRSARLLSAAKLVGYSAFLHPRVYGIPARLPWLSLGKTIYATDFPLELYKPELAAMARLLFDRLDAFNDTRIATAGRILRELAGVDGLRAVATHDGARPVYLRCALLLRDPAARAGLVRALEQAGLGASTSYPTAVDEIPDLRPLLVNREQRFAGGREVARSILTLPTHPYVRERDVSRMTGIIRRFPLGVGRS